jgi:hypothetical protein
MSRIFAAFLLSGSAAWSFTACGGEDGGAEPFCEKDTVTYCRCRGGDAGTRQCNADGTAFDSCVSDTTFEACEEIPDPGTGTTTGNNTGTGTGSGGAGGGGGPGTEGLFTPCAEGAECASGTCEMGYCTKPCTTYRDCLDGSTVGDCMTAPPPGIGDICVPYCSTQTNCNQYGEPSLCGFGLAVDDFEIVVCADWGSSLAFPPDGTECGTDVECSLGHLGSERICVFESCTTGCYIDDDCPLPLFCSASGGNPGTCI